MAGRPTKLTPEVSKKIEEAAALGCTLEEIAFYAGITRETLYQWCKADKDLSYRIEELRETPILKARQTVVNALDDPKQASWYLEKKRKTEFGNAVDITTKGESIVTNSPLPEVLEAVNAELKRRELGQEEEEVN